MPRIELDLPEHFPFKTVIEVRPMDVDPHGRLDLQALRLLMDEARIKFFLSKGYRGRDIEGAETILTDAVVIREEHATGGDALVFEVAIQKFSRTGCDLFYRISSTRTGAEVAKAKTAIAFMDPCTGGSIPVPERFWNKFL